MSRERRGGLVCCSVVRLECTQTAAAAAACTDSVYCVSGCIPIVTKTL